MIPFLSLSIIAALLVLFMGRKNAARDPRLTLTLLVLLASYPVMVMWMPKVAIVPAPASAAIDTGLSWKQILLTIWLAGSLIAAARLLVARIVLYRWNKQSVLLHKVDEVEVRMLNSLSSPVAAGILRKIIHVPESWNEQDREVREMILAHELTHHRRNDPLWKLCAEIACVVHWFNPLVHWMAGRLSLQCELACDADVIHQGTDKARYASLLCDFASDHRQPALAISMAGMSTLEQRIRGIVKPGKQGSITVMLLCGIVGLGSAFALSMITTQKLQRPASEHLESQIRLTAEPFPGTP